MSNRFATISLVLLVTFFGGIILFVIGLFLFPGISLFGIRYVSLDGRAVTTYNAEGQPGPSIIHDRIGDDFSGIIINAYEVPVYVEFTDNRQYSLEYIDNFNGLTTSKIEYPSIEFKKDEMGNAVITVSEFKKFIYESTTSTRHIRLLVPIRDVDSTAPFARDITINSTKSTVEFSKEEGESRIPKFHHVSIKTNGKVKYNTEVKAHYYTLETSNSIVIDKESKKCVNATKGHYLKSTAGSITIEKDEVGELKVETNQGNISFRNCDTLEAKTNYGKISYNFLPDEEKEGKGIVVYGNAIINSKAGSVEISKINGSVPSEITTTSGNVVVDKLYFGKVITKRGLVDINESNVLEVESNTGKIIIEEVTNNLIVKTVRSNITLGGENKKMKDVDVFSRIGKVTMLSSTGSTKIETLKGDVDYTNLSSEYIDITCGGKLNATGLRGFVKLTSQENVKLSFADIGSEDITIELGSKCTSAEITALNNRSDEVNYFIKGSQVLIKENQNNSEVLLKDTKEYQIKADSTCHFNITGENAVISICFKSSDKSSEGAA